MSQKLSQLKSLLRELFQLDQPDLDFGIYRVLHARSDEVTQFLENDLLPQVRAAFAQYQSADKAEILRAIDLAIQQARALGADPDSLPKVRELRARLAHEAVDVAQLENEVYDHLLGFFRRYYSEGDFLARRVYKPGVYAIPYEGEEVTLHWANKDQYYIKTSEYLRDYAFRMRPAEARHPMRVHFRLADAAEGEHGNAKAAEGKDRVFILSLPSPDADFITQQPGPDGPELVIRFEYRPATLHDWHPGALPGSIPQPDPKAHGKPPTQKDLLAIATQRILALPVSHPVTQSGWTSELSKPHTLANGQHADYSRLEAHLRRYAARNTFDYFIHKDLGAFLRRELDFYVKNEVLHLDDVENEAAPRVEQYLSKIKVLRKIAGKIIAFLASIEDFQKKLWLKKKFVVESHYCIALGAIPESFYPEIAANQAQHQEWVRLYAIDQIKGDLVSPGYTNPINIRFLQCHPSLLIDTRHFPKHFSDELISVVCSADSSIDVQLIHGENSGGLELIKPCYSQKIDCIYIDPPYNTGTDGFCYKDSYPHSTWLTMMEDRLARSRRLLKPMGLIFSSIDDGEVHQLRNLADSVFGESSFVGTLTWKSTTQPDNIGKARFGLQQDIEYILLHASCIRTALAPFKLRHSGVTPTYPHQGRFGPCRFEIIERAFEGAYARPTMLFPILGQHPRPGKQWQIGEDKARQLEASGKIELVDGIIKRAVYPEDDAGDESGLVPFWAHIEDVGTSQSGKTDLNSMLGRSHGFETVKPIDLLSRLLSHVPNLETCLDYFGGSGTTAHSVINLNRDDGGRRKCILIEVGNHFDTVLVPRIKKVAYTPEWKDGKPRRLATREEAERGPRVIKVIRLESYEDTLNNLEVRRSPEQQLVLSSQESGGAGGLREQYLLRYMLNVETRGSQSLLNVQAFRDPTAYKLKVKRPGSDESRETSVDLLETFNWLVGLTVRHVAAPRSFAAGFERDVEGRLRIQGRLRQDEGGTHWFRTVTGTTPDGRRALVIWRNLPGDAEQDNLVLDEWFTKQGYSSKDGEFDVIWVNGGNNLENLKTQDDRWKVRLIEEDFHRLMFETEDV